MRSQLLQCMRGLILYNIHSAATRRRWQHDVDGTTKKKSDRGKAWLPNTSGAREAEDDIQQQTPTPEDNIQGLGEQIHSSNEATDRSVTKTRFTHFKNTNSMRDTGDDTAHMVFEGEPAVKLHSKNV